MNAVGLSDRQLDLVRRAAACLPPQWRSRFLESVVDHLIGEVDAYGTIGDGHVEHAVECTLRRIGIVT
jgi:hypothetical protein